MTVFKSTSAEETKAIAAHLAKKMNHGIIALTGDLGAGKTTFTQGIARGLGIKDKIISPTFVLIRQHHIPKTNRVLYHIDLYRLEDNIDIKSLGIEEIINNSDNLVLIEWAEKIKKYLPKDTIFISIKIIDKNNREIYIENF